jgi:hypothetical protein
VPSEARKRGSGGGFPRKYDDLLTGPSDLDVHTRQICDVLAWLSSDLALPVTARRAKRKNGGLGEDPPGSTMTD